MVSPVRHAGFDDGGEGHVFFCGGPVGRAEDEEVRDEVRVPEGCSVGDGAALGGFIEGEYSKGVSPWGREGLCLDRNGLTQSWPPRMMVSQPSWLASSLMSSAARLKL